MRTIIADTNDGLVRIEGIPDNAKITFGPVQPGKQAYGDANCLRIYTSTSNQLAVVLGVRSFRDTSLTITRRHRKVTSEARVETGPDGSEIHRKEEFEYEWREVGEDSGSDAAPARSRR